MRKRIGKIVSIFFIILISIIVIYMWISKKEYYSGDGAWNELLALDTDVTMQILQEKGYIDVSQVMGSENSAITSFLKDARNRERGVLRIAGVSDDKLYAKILVCGYSGNPETIVMWTIYPNTQQGQAPKCFATEPFSVNEDSVISVYLENIPDYSFPDWDSQKMIDEKLYSYSAQ